MKKLIKNPEGEEPFMEIPYGEYPIHLVDYYDTIENLEDNMPKDRRSKEYKSWVKTINKVINDCNKLAGYKLYKSVV